MTSAATQERDLEKLLGETVDGVTANARLVASAKEHTDKIEDAAKKAAAALLCTPDLLKTVAGIVAAVKAGVFLKICITIARPFIEHHMLSAVAAVSGRDTGATLYGPADMQISANTSVKTIEGHFTCYTKSVITKPQNVMVLRDIMCNGYVAGGNCHFFGTNGKRITDANPLTHIAVQQGVADRLAYVDDLDATYGSML